MAGSRRSYPGFFLIAAILFLVVSGCNSGAESSSRAAGMAPAVQVVPVEPRNVSLSTEWIATLDGYVNSQIQPHVSGYLIRQDYREGSVVRNGDVLFEIDPRPFQAALDQAKGQLAQSEAQVIQAQAQLAKAEQDVSRDTPLAEARAIAQSQMDNDVQEKAGAAAAVTAAQAAVLAGKAALENAQLNLSFTKITSLVDGVAGFAQAQIGDLVSTTTLLTSVSQVDPIKAYFPISEQDYLKAQKIGTKLAGKEGAPLEGLPLTLKLADGSTYPYPGRVLWADRQVDPSTGTIRVAAAFPNHENILRPGGFARVSAVTESRDKALLVPEPAVTELQGTFQVAVVGGDNKVTIQNVQVGAPVGADRIVTQGLNAGDHVIVAGLQYARQGATVTPQLVSSAPAETH